MKMWLFSTFLLVAALSAGCGSSTSPDDGDSPPTNSGGTGTTTTPPPTTTTPPTTEFDGSYHASTWFSGIDSCNPPFMIGNFNASFVIQNAGRNLTITQALNGGVRTSSGTAGFVPGAFGGAPTASLSGSGTFQNEPATWSVTIDTRLGIVTITETIRMTNRGNCGTFYINGVTSR